MRKKIIARLIDYNYGMNPKGLTIYPDMGMPVRFRMWDEQHKAIHIEGINITCLPGDREIWPEASCEHEWSLISRKPREDWYWDQEIFFCDKCAAIGPEKIITVEQGLTAVQNCFGISPALARASGMFKLEPQISKT